MLTETLPHGSLVPWKRRRGGCFSSAGGLPERFTVQQEHTLASGRVEKEPERPPRRINRRATMATMRGKSYSLLLVYFVAEVQRHFQARHMYYSVSSAFERTRFWCLLRVDGRLYWYRIRFVCVTVLVWLQSKALHACLPTPTQVYVFLWGSPWSEGLAKNHLRLNYS